MTLPVRYEVEAGVATITLDRPESRNRLDLAAMSMLADHLARAAEDGDVRVVVLTGSGTAFCAGADLSAAQDADGFAGTGPTALVRVLTAMLEHPKPVVARVQGHVAGGGNGLVAAADIAVASSQARFAFSEVRVGVAPSVISSVCLRVMHRREAQQLMLTGDRVDADRVLRAGLVTAVAHPDALDAVVRGYVESLLEGGPQALARTKELIRRVPDLGLRAALAWTAVVSAESFASDEAREGMSAYLEKRPAAWSPASGGQ